VRHYTLRSWRDRELARWSLAGVAETFGAPNATVRRETVLRALSCAVPPAALFTGHAVASVRESTAGVTVRLADGSSMSADLVVGADGLHSVLRGHVTGDTAPARYAGYDSWRATATHSPAPLGDGTAVHVLGSGRTFGAWPLPDGRAYWVATLAEPRADAAPGTALAGAPPLVRELLAATDPGDVLRTPIYDRDPVPEWHTARCVLVGDAVHPMQPTTGQGAAQALLDALALTAALRGIELDDTDALAHALAAYRARRAHAAAAMVLEARAIGRMHHVNSPVGTRVRDLVLRATPRRIWQRRAQARPDELQLLSDFELAPVTRENTHGTPRSDLPGAPGHRATGTTHPE
jgi:2-polyprenyl-6-methoxyphenol hydroxylase-like FAD-dependent oxidoreductase